MATSNNVCYYGQRIGCPYANDPNCRRCAERLTYGALYSSQREQRASGGGNIYAHDEIILGLDQVVQGLQALFGSLSSDTTTIGLGIIPRLWPK